MWLESPVAEGGGSSGEPEKWSRAGKGTPQGGVISPLLSNLYLHWFDKVFCRSSEAARAKAILVRYADDFVVLVPRYVGPELTRFIEHKLETWLGLEINREKTRVVNLKEKGASLDFLGFTFRYHDDLKGRGWQYLNVTPSAKALKKEREKLRDDWAKPVLPADPETDSESEPATGWMGELLSIRVSAGGLPGD
jgi:RNA-directed DNA polymerase